MIDAVPIEAGRIASTSAGLTEIGGRRVVSARLGTADGSAAPLLPADGELLAASARLARARALPLVWHFSSAGAPVDGGVGALHGWGEAAKELTACSGVVPLICFVPQTALAGSALLLGLFDIVIMAEDAYAYVSGPRAVQEYTGVPIDSNALGGAALHSRTNGVASLLARDADHAEESIADLLGYLPANADELPPVIPTADPTDRPTPGVAAVIPEVATGSYDMRAVVREVVDDGELLELRAAWATNLVTGLASVGGHAVGIVANQPQALAGTLDIAASQKGGRFVAFCDAFNLPIFTLVDTPGFYPGKDLEWRGMIRHGAQMAFAYARATVPRVNLTVRKSYGGAYIVMDSKHMGNDIAIALPSAEIAVMGARGAVEILHRGAAPAERAALEAEYEERLLNPYRAAERGSIDLVADPDKCRELVAASLKALASKRERLPRRRHDNMPL